MGEAAPCVAMFYTVTQTVSSHLLVCKRVCVLVFMCMCFLKFIFLAYALCFVHPLAMFTAYLLFCR